MRQTPVRSNLTGVFFVLAESLLGMDSMGEGNFLLVGIGLATPAHKVEALDMTSQPPLSDGVVVW